MRTQITVLAVPGCPNAPLMRERIDAALAGRRAEVEVVEVPDEEQAAARGMTGSPTVLVDGVDPFAQAAAGPGVACRLYRAADGGVEGSPAVEDLRRVFERAGLRDVPEGEQAEQGYCCSPGEGLTADLLDPLGRAGRGRRAPAEAGLRAVHQAVLRHFAESGTAPGPDVLEPVAGAAGRRAEDVLAELAREDFLTLDASGGIHAAYPFSAVPTRHRVRIEGGARVWSMCAIDALGIPAMLGRDAVISSTDPETGAPVTVAVPAADGRSTWEPSDAVVFVGRRTGASGTEPAARSCCGVLNFFASPASARAWAEGHPQVTGTVVGRSQAEDLGRRIFGPLLDP